jgi:hypothetical protein
MKTWERLLIVVAFVYTLPLALSPVLAPQKLIWLWRQPHGPAFYLALLAIGLVLTIASFVVAFRDFLKRPFTDRMRALWFVVLLFGGALGALFYLQRHGRHPQGGPERP